MSIPVVVHGQRIEFSTRDEAARALATGMQMYRQTARNISAMIYPCHRCGESWFEGDLHDSAVMHNDGMGEEYTCDGCKGELDNMDFADDYHGCKDWCKRCEDILKKGAVFK